MPEVSAYAPDGVPDVVPGDDLVALLLPLVELADGEIVAVTSKVVAKAEGRIVEGERDALLPGETVRVVARRGPTTIVRTRHGLTLAAGGIDASNVARGSVVLLPEDPDGSARRIRADIAARTGRNVGVVVTDTAGRAWREGQTDIAIGAAGLLVAEDYAARVDAHGNELAVTAPAVADEIAGLAELAQGKLTGRPFAVVRGRADLVLPTGEDGPGAAALVRAEGADLFGYGAREAVLRAARGEPADAAPFGDPVPLSELHEALAGAGLRPDDPGHLAVARIVAFAHGWHLDPPTADGDIGLRPLTP
jgi:coenzyme F420-0:L-glutamate ligase / coenzyme F420-1:gamma-L-glutamate ligase